MSTFKVGQKVQIENMKEIAETLDIKGYHIDTDLYFNPDMKKFIGKIYVIKRVEDRRVQINSLDGEYADLIIHYVWHPDWLKPTGTTLDEAEEL